MARRAHTLSQDYLDEQQIPGDDEYGAEELLDDIRDTVGYHGDGNIRRFDAEEVRNAVVEIHGEGSDQEGFLDRLLKRAERPADNEDLNIIELMLGSQRGEEVHGYYQQEGGYCWLLDE